MNMLNPLGQGNIPNWEEDEDRDPILTEESTGETVFQHVKDKDTGKTVPHIEILGDG